MPQYDANLDVGLNLPQNSISNLQRQIDAVERQLKPINLRFNTSTSQFAALNKEVGQFSGYLERANQRVLGFGASVASLYGTVRFFKEIVTSTIEVEKALTDMNSIFRLSSQSLDRFSKSLFDVARNTSQSFEAATDAAKEFARQGLGVEETLKRTQAALILTRVASLTVAESVNTVTAAINSFTKENLNALQVLNKLATVDQTFAVSSKDLANALTRVGSAASDAGVGFDQLIALVTSARQITGRDGAVIAQALNTIFTRVNRTDTIDLLESLGVAVRDTRGEMLPTIDVLRNFSITYDKLSGSIKTQAAEAVGGVRNLNTLKAVLTDLAKTQSVYSQVLNISSQSTDEAVRRNEALNKSASALLQNLATTNKQILSNVGSLSFSGLFKSGLSAATDNPITKALEDASGHAETTGGKIAEGIIRGLSNSLIIGAGPIIAVALSNVVARTLKSAAAAIGEEAGLNRQSLTQANIQKEINALYAQGGAGLRAQVMAMTELADRAAVVEGILARQRASAARMGLQDAELAGAVLARRTPRAAGGFIPYGAEASAIAAGVGGAPAGAKPVYLPDFPTGGGSRGIVANTSEWIVPTMAGGSAIFNRDMISKLGLPAGAKPVAAGGFIPNAAGGGFSYGDIRQDSGAPLSKSGIGALNQLLDKLASSETRKGAESVSRDIINITQTLNKTSQDRVLEKVGAELTKFDKGLNTAAMRARIVTDQSRYSPYVTPAGGGGPDFDVNGQPPRGRVNYGGSLTYQAHGPYGPGNGGFYQGPTPPPLPLSRGRQFLNELNSPRGQLAAAFGLPFVGGLVEGLPNALGYSAAGGTRGGMATAGFAGAFNGAGLGAGIGSFMGPGGAALGLGIGAGLGGLNGVLSKLTQSFEELSAVIEEKNRTLAAEFDKTAQVFRLQDQIREETFNGDKAAVAALTRQRDAQMASIRDPQYRAFAAANLNDPEGLVNLTRMGSGRSLSQRGQGDLISAFTDSRGFLRQLGDLQSGMLGFDTSDPKQEAGARAALSSILGTMSRSQLGGLQRLNGNDPNGALAQIAKAAGLSESDIKGLNMGRTFNQGAISDALHSALNQGITPKGAGRTGGAGITRDQVADLIAFFSHQAQSTQIQGGASFSIGNVAQRIALSQNTLTDVGRLNLEGGFGRQNIAAQSAMARSAQLSEGRGNLARILQQNKITDPFAYDRVEGLHDLNSLRALDANLVTPQGKAAFGGGDRNGFAQALKDLIKQMELLDETERANVRVNDETNRLMREDLTARKTPDMALARLFANRAANLNAAYINGGMSDQAFYGSQINLGNEQDMRNRQNTGQGIQSLLASGKGGLLSGDQVSSGLFGLAQNAGRSPGGSGLSFGLGFQSVFAGIKQDLLDLSSVGQQVAQSLNASLGNAFGSFVTGAQTASQAARSFFASFFGQASQMFGQRAILGLLSAIPAFGGGHAMGGPVGLASGGMVSTMLTGGEFYVNPQAAANIGNSNLMALNRGQRLAGGGPVMGGSGLRDDVHMMAPNGSFVVKKTATQQLGVGYLQNMVNNAVRRADGGFTGSLPSFSPSGSMAPTTLTLSNSAAAPASAGASAGAMGGMGGTLGSLAASLILAVAGRLLSGGGGNRLLDAAGVTNNVNSMVASQAASINGRPSGSSVYLQSDGRGSQTLLSFGSEAISHNYSAAGGPIGTPMTMGSTGGASYGGGSPAVHVTINNHSDGTTTTSAKTEGGDRDFAERMGRAIKATVQEEMVNATRAGGLFQRNGRYSQSNYVS